MADFRIWAMCANVLADACFNHKFAKASKGFVATYSSQELCFFTDVRCYHFIGAYAKPAFCLRDHSFGLRAGRS